MTRFFCSGCWADSPEDLAVCPRCGLAIHEAWGGKDRVEKLLLALGHRDASTGLPAAWLLGESGDPRAVAALAAAARSTPDPYLARAAVRALGAIGGAEAAARLDELQQHPARMVRREVKAARQRLTAAA